MNLFLKFYATVDFNQLLNQIIALVWEYIPDSKQIQSELHSCSAYCVICKINGQNPIKPLINLFISLIFTVI